MRIVRRVVVQRRMVQAEMCEGLPSVIVAILRLLWPRWSREFMLAVLVCGGVAVFAFARQSYAQKVPPYSRLPELLKNCAPDQRIEFALPSATLHLKFRWLASTTIIDLFEASGPMCPTTPMRMERVYLAGSVLKEIGIGEVWARKGIRLYVGDLSPFGSEAGLERLREASIEMEFSPAYPQARRYTLHYPKAIGSTEVRVFCNGDFGNRECSTFRPDPYAGVYLWYSLSQTVLPIPNEVSTDPATEPGAVLQLHTSLRSFIGNAEQRP